MQRSILPVSFNRDEKGFVASVNGDIPQRFHIPDYIKSSIKEERYSLPRLKEIGETLFFAVFNTEEREKRVEDILKREDAELSVCIQSDDLEIQRYPWEVLYLNKKFLLRQENFSLYRASKRDVLPTYEEIEYPLRLLVILSLPIPVLKESPISILKEWETLYEKVLKEYVKQGKLQVTVEEETSKKSLTQEHFDERGKYHLVHFIGHGRGGGKLLLENDYDPEAEPEELEAERAEEIFGRKGIVSIFFNACETGLSIGNIPDLLYSSHIKGGIPVAIGYQRSILDKTAIEIARFYYQYFLEKKDILGTLGKIRRMMEVEESWWLPVLWLSKDPSQAVPKITGTPRPKKVVYQKELIPIGEDFIYRWGPIRRIGRALREKRTRAILLYGVNGTGKSSIASYISKFYKPLFNITTSYQLRKGSLFTSQQIIKELYFHSKGREIKGETVEELWKRFVEDKAGEGVLLILDDLDEVLDLDGRPETEDWEEFIDLLLRTDWGGKVIITSRVRLNLPSWKPGEIPGSLEVLKISGFSRWEGRMFFEKEDEEVKRFGEETLGFHPLGMRLFLEKSKEYGEKAVMENLSYILEVLEERGFSLYEEFLSEEERKEFLKLAVVPGYFPPEYMESLDLKSELRKKIEDWALIEGERVDGEIWIRVPPILARYFIQKLDSEELQETRKIAAEWFMKEGEKRKDLKLLRPAFWLWSYAGERKEAEPLMYSMMPYLDRWGLWDEEEKMLLSLANLTQKEGAKKSLSTIYHNLGKLAQYRGNYKKTEKFYLKSLKMLEELGDRREIAKRYHNFGILAQLKGNDQKAKEFYLRSLKIFEKLGAKSEMGASYGQIGMLAKDKGEYKRAEKLYRKALEIYEELKDKESIAGIFHNLGVLAQLRKENHKAEKFYEKALEIFKELRNKLGTAKSYGQLSWLAQERGESKKAEELCRQSLKIFEELNDRIEVAESYHQLGTLAQLRGEYEEAKECFLRAFGIYKELGMKTRIASVYHNLGILEQEGGNYKAAEKLYEKSLEMFKELQEDTNVAKSYSQLGILVWLKKEYFKAREFYEKSLKIYERLGDKSGKAKVYHYFGMLAQDQKDCENAEKFYLSSLKIFEELGDKTGVAISYHRLGVLAQDREDYEKAERFYLKSQRIVEKFDRIGVVKSKAEISRLKLRQWEKTGEEELLREGLKLGFSAFEELYHIGNVSVRVVVENLRILRQKIGEEKFEKMAREINPYAYTLFQKKVLKKSL